MSLQFSSAVPGKLGVAVENFSIEAATAEDFAQLREQVYAHRVVVLKNQQEMTPAQFVELGKAMGTIVPYYEPMYHHPEHHEIFVSSNAPAEEGKRVGVPKTGKFWHSDYQFKEHPFSFTLFAPQVLPEGNRGTFFIDMAEAFAGLSDHLKEAARRTTAAHSVRRFFKIRPEDVFRPLGEIVAEVEKVSPPAIHNTVVTHPKTGEEILYLSEGFTDAITGPEGESTGTLLQDLLAASGQLDQEFTHPNIKQHAYDPGDVVIWDNRVMCHRALHVVGNGVSVSHRITVVDELPFDAGAVAGTSH